MPNYICGALSHLAFTAQKLGQYFCQIHGNTNHRGKIMTSYMLLVALPVSRSFDTATIRSLQAASNSRSRRQEASIFQVLLGWVVWSMFFLFNHVQSICFMLLIFLHENM